jgi:hypothetical protein
MVEVISVYQGVNAAGMTMFYLEPIYEVLSSKSGSLLFDYFPVAIRWATKLNTAIEDMNIARL